MACLLGGWLAIGTFTAAASDPSIEADVNRRILSTVPELNRMTVMSLGEIARIMHPSGEASADVQAVLYRPDPRFTTFGDPHVPVEIRLIEFMRQDMVRSLEPVRTFSAARARCGLANPLNFGPLADAQTRQYTLRSLDCIDRAVAAMRATLQDQQQDSLARISLLQLPPSSDAAVRHYFAQRATEWRNDPDPEGQQRAALRNCIAFIGAHTAHVAAHGDLLVIDDPELLKQFQQLMAPLSGPKRPP